MTKIRKNLNSSNFKSLSDIYNKVEQLEKTIANLYNAVLIERTAVNNALHNNNINQEDYIRKETAYRKYRNLGTGLTNKRIDYIIANRQIKTRQVADTRSSKGYATLLNEYELVKLLTLEERDKIVVQKSKEPFFDIATLRMIAKGKKVGSYDKIS